MRRDPDGGDLTVDARHNGDDLTELLAVGEAVDRDRLNYIADLIAELRDLASGMRLMMLMRMLELAHAEARRTASQDQPRGCS